MAIDFSFPEWLTRQHSFADSLLKGAQVGSIIANNRYRNQALAAQVMESERNYDLREKQLNAQIRTEDLNYQLQSQLIEDRTADKATLTDYFKQMAPLSLQERVALPPPTNLRLLESYRIVNQVSDNNRLAYAQTEQGKAADRIQYRIRQLPSDYQYLYDSTQDPEEKHRILQQGEAEMERRAVELRSIAAPGKLQKDYDFLRDELGWSQEQLDSFIAANAGTSATGGPIRANSIQDDSGNVIGHYVGGKGGLHVKWDKPEKEIAPSQRLSANRILIQSYENQMSLLNRKSDEYKALAKQRDSVLEDVKSIEKESGNPEASKSSPRVRVRSPDGKTGTISADKLDAALKQGYQRVE